MSNFSSINAELTKLMEELREETIQIRAEFRKIRNEDQENELYDRIGGVVTDLMMYFSYYPQLMQSIQKGKTDSNERSMVQLFDRLEKEAQGVYFSFVALKDLTLAMERHMSSIMYRRYGRV